jgi:hypothetical protein
MRLSFLISVMLCLSASASPCRQAPGSVSAIDRYLVDHYLSDPVLKRSWAVMIDCRHPGWPAQAVEVQAAGAGTRPLSVSQGMNTGPSARPAPAVHSGSRVELWSDGDARIRLSGIALESAIVGQPVRVRAGLGATPLSGTVRGAHSVELTEGSKTGRREP